MLYARLWYVYADAKRKWRHYSSPQPNIIPILQIKLFEGKGDNNVWGILPKFTSFVNDSLDESVAELTFLGTNIDVYR